MMSNFKHKKYIKLKGLLQLIALNKRIQLFIRIKLLNFMINYLIKKIIQVLLEELVDILRKKMY